MKIEEVLKYKGVEAEYCVNEKCPYHYPEDRYGCKLWGIGLKRICDGYIDYKTLTPKKD